MTVDELLAALLGLDGRDIGDDAIKTLDASVVAEVRDRLNAARRRLRPGKPNSRGAGLQKVQRLLELVDYLTRSLSMGVTPETALSRAVERFRNKYPKLNRFAAKRLLRDYGLIPIDATTLRKFLNDYRERRKISTGK